MKQPKSTIPFNCPKCNNSEAIEDVMQATGRTFSKLFSIQNRRFTIKSCTNCGFTEFYRKHGSKKLNIIDFFVG